MSLFDARQLLAAAKDEYQRRLRAIDTRLQQAVAQNPANETEARAIQAEYATGFTAVVPVPLVHPVGPPPDEPLPEPEPVNVVDGPVEHVVQE